LLAEEQNRLTTDSQQRYFDMIDYYTVLGTPDQDPHRIYAAHAAGAGQRALPGV